MSSKKVAVVTGANKGIGFEVVKALCKKFDGDVYLTARDEARGNEAVSTLEKEGLHPKFHLLAINDPTSIEKLRDFLLQSYGGLDVLVNNAGMAFKNDSKEPVFEQAQKTMEVNFFATRNVFNILLPILKKHARVVNVSSAEGQLGKIVSEDLRTKFSSPELTEKQLIDLINEYLSDVISGNHIEKGWPRTTYQMSKVAVTALTFLQQRKLNMEPDKDIVVNAVHPGYVETDMSSHKGDIKPEEGAVAPTYCALLEPNVTSPRGEFVWNDCKVAPWE